MGQRFRDSGLGAAVTTAEATWQAEVDRRVVAGRLCEGNWTIEPFLGNSSATIQTHGMLENVSLRIGLDPRREVEAARSKRETKLAIDWEMAWMVARPHIRSRVSRSGREPGEELAAAVVAPRLSIKTAPLPALHHISFLFLLTSTLFLTTAAIHQTPPSHVLIHPTATHHIHHHVRRSPRAIDQGRFRH